MSLTNHGENAASNARAELGAILEALRQNECDDLEIESDSLTSLRAICSDAEKYEDRNWLGVQNADLLKSILIKLRTRPARTAFKWVKGHDDNYGNNEADRLANEGRESEDTLRLDNEEWVKNHSALQDGARIQALGAKHTYAAVLEWLPKITLPTKYLEAIKEAKNRVEEATGLRPTTEQLTKGFRALGVPTRLRDRMRCIVNGKLKCGTFWSNIPGYEDRAYCSFCRKKGLPDTIESEQHIWIDCENNGQSQAWETSRRIWRKTTDRSWPVISTGLIRGTTALSFKDGLSKDSERLRILISMTIWSIWKSRNENTINNRDVTPGETTGLLEELIRDLIRKSWNSTRFMEGRDDNAPSRSYGLRGDSPISIRRKGLQSISHRRDVAGIHRHGRVLVGRSGGRLSNGHNGPSASHTGVPHTAHGALRCMTHFPPFPHPKKDKY